MRIAFLQQLDRLQPLFSARVNSRLEVFQLRLRKALLAEIGHNFRSFLVSPLKSEQMGQVPLQVDLLRKLVHSGAKRLGGRLGALRKHFQPREGLISPPGIGTKSERSIQDRT